MSQIVNKESDYTPTFEDFKNENGLVFWRASDLMKMLGYKEMKVFSKAIDRAIKACITLSIPYFDNFKEEKRPMDNKEETDCKLSRFACYLTVMNADPKKKEVALAQVYFAEQTRKFELYIRDSRDFDRILTRDEIREGNKSLGSTAQRAGVHNFAKFHNIGYLGLYNMGHFELACKRGVSRKDLIEYMGRSELAANLFRITQTEERIKNYQVNGQENLEQTHYKVGKKVRKFVIDNTGKEPEEFPLKENYPKYKKKIKAGYKKMLLEDKKSPKA